MRPFQKSFRVLVFVIAMCMGGQQQPAAAQPAGTVTFQIFYDALSPYGDWIYEARYGYVWVPAEAGFHPYYTNGYWEMTPFGNTWISMYPWGWAPFHYGRWTYDPFFGWLWVPGYQWAPAWVCWRYGGGVYIWAPISPGFIIISLGSYSCPDNWWVYTPRHYLYGPRHSSHYQRNPGSEPIRSSSILNRTMPGRETGELYPMGPSVEEIRLNTGQDVVVRDVEIVPSADLAVSGTSAVRLFRPEISHPDQASPRPSKYLNAPRPIKPDQPVSDRPGRPAEYKNPPEPVSDRPDLPERKPQPAIREQPDRPDRQPAREPVKPIQQPVRPAPKPPVTERQRPAPTRPKVQPVQQPRQTVPATPKPVPDRQQQRPARPVGK